MTLTEPFMISSRLLPAVQVGDATISIERDFSHANRWRYHLDLPTIEHSENDLCCRGDIRAAIGALLGFMGACAESYRYRLHTGLAEPDPDSNENLFPPPIAEWCYMHSDEIALVGIEIENLVTD